MKNKAKIKEDKMKGFLEAKVSQCFPLTEEARIFLLELAWPFREEPQAGQFVLLEPLIAGSVMPRPFSVHNYRKGKIQLMIKHAGKNTAIYSQLRPGKRIKVSGPHGRPLAIDSKAKKYLLLGGGIGVAPLGLIGKVLDKQGKAVRFLLGAKSHAELVTEMRFEDYGEVEEVTEDRGGLATDLLAKHLKKDKGNSVVIVCGPRAMLKKVAEMCATAGNKCHVLLEEVMACGVGSCKGCAIFGKDGSVRHVCQDGPAFDAKWVDWEKLVPSATGVLSPVFSVLPRISPKTDEPFKTVLKGNGGEDLILAYPTMNASGCLGIEQAERMDLTGVGALVTKGIKVLPVAGNRMPRVCETTSGMINSIGLEGPGIEVFIGDELPRWLKLGKPVIANIAGETVEEYVQLAKTLSETDVAGIEVNVSCPNVAKGGVHFGVNAKDVHAITKAVCAAAYRKFIIVKLTPNVTDIAEIADAVREAGADAVSLINTVLGMSIDPYTRRPRIGNVMGGLSGPAIKPIAVRMVHQAVVKVRIPSGFWVIGMGGITNGEDAAEFLIAGASAVAVGTALFKNPSAMAEIIRDLKKIMAHNGANHISDLAGSLIV